MTIKPKLIIHGGCRKITPGDSKVEKSEKALREIIDAAYPVLLREGARKAVVEAVRLLEDCPLFNAGRGSKIQRDGKIRMSASLMDSENQIFSGVVNIEDVQNPIRIADLLSGEPHTILGAQGALDYARDKGFAPFDPTTESRLQDYLRQRKGDTGTVGAVAVGADGIIAAATSTGGTGYETPGRVSDTPTVAGNYASNMAGVSMTGRGEEIVNIAAASRIVGRVEDGMLLSNAVGKLIDEADERGYRMGLIAVDRTGRIVWDSTKNTDLQYASHDGNLIKSFLEDF